MKFRDHYKSLLEGFESQKYSSILTKRRLHYPRGIDLSPEFQKAFQKEFARIKQTYNLSKIQTLEKIKKALLWFAN